MFGLYPAHVYSVLFLFVPLILWLVGLPRAKKRQLSIMHNSSFAVSFWEEILFRGIIFGLTLHVSDSLLAALIVSSLLFGLFHLRNLWWASPKQVLINCLYTGLILGPMLGLVRWWSGDIYLCIALHALHNFLSENFAANAPTDRFLRSKQGSMNWFERFFSGFWLTKNR